MKLLAYGDDDEDDYDNDEIDEPLKRNPYSQSTAWLYSQRAINAELRQILCC